MTAERPVVSLVAAARGGDTAAFSKLVETFYPLAWGYARALLGDPGLAEDACQEAFIDAFLQLERLRENAAFSSWLRRIVLKHADRQRRRRLIATELGELPGASDPLADTIKAEEVRTVRASMDALPERLRRAIQLFYSEGLSVAEIAVFLDASPTAVKKRLFDGRARLRTSLSAQRPDAKRRGPEDTVSLLIATRTGDHRLAAAILARRPDLTGLTEPRAEVGQGPDYGVIVAGYTLVQRAVFMGHVEVVEVLLRAGSPLSARAGLGPLDLAVLQGDSALTKMLLDAGATANGRGATGVMTPIHRAAMRGHEEIVRLLLEAGAQPAATGPGGRTPADWARLKGHHRVAQLIEEWK